MNIETLIEKHKCNKFKEPVSAVQIGDLDIDLLENIKSNITKKYNLNDEMYSTSEKVFFNTRRIVIKTAFIKTQKQLYTNLDFDYNLSEMVHPLVNSVKLLLGNSEPVLMQIATIMPDQKLLWHVDTYLYQQFSNKIHIPLYTNEKAYYDIFVNGGVKRTHLSFGHMWNINNLDLHRSINMGSTPRSHLIMDFIDKGLLEILESTGINYFHHKLDEMSIKEGRQIAELGQIYSQ